MVERASSPDLIVRVPPTPVSVRVLRSVTRSLATEADFSIEEIDDLCLAVDEAYSVLTAAGDAVSGVSMRLELNGHGVAVDMTAVTEEGAWKIAQARRSLAWQVLKALAVDVAFEASREGPSIRFTKQARRRSDSQTG